MHPSVPFTTGALRIYVAPAGQYTSTDPNTPALATVDTEVHYPGAPAKGVRERQSIRISGTITILDSHPNPRYRAEYYLRRTERDIETGGAASIRFNLSEAATSPSDSGGAGHLLAEPFTPHQPIPVSIELNASAYADSNARHPEAAGSSAQAELKRITGYDPMTNSDYGISYLWDPLNVTVTLHREP